MGSVQLLRQIGNITVHIINEETSPSNDIRAIITSYGRQDWQPEDINRTTRTQTTAITFT